MRIKRNVFVYNLGEAKRDIIFDEIDTCPSCKRGIQAIYISGHVDSISRASIFNYCRMCNKSFISIYNASIPEPWVPSSAQLVTFNQSVPFEFEERIFDVKINKLSPRFSSVYNQAKKAEDFALNEIAGMGYRKSLEILIKDYAIFLKPQDSAAIIDPKFTLSQCITTYITDVQLKDVSKLTAWLGNDETHYTRVHVNQDINDLKEYLDAAILYISFDLTVKKASAIVNP